MKHPFWLAIALFLGLADAAVILAAIEPSGSTPAGALGAAAGAVFLDVAVVIVLTIMGNSS